ncbi:hypothetical protein, partial [Faecalibaculum rodentium]|uniref:hypothetical protein n=1 Tax=Faecalibaculum rodentium TaxID=1702221 RepID=UPI00260C004D
MNWISSDEGEPSLSRIQKKNRHRVRFLFASERQARDADDGKSRPSSGFLLAALLLQDREDARNRQCLLLS